MPPGTFKWCNGAYPLKTYYCDNWCYSYSPQPAYERAQVGSFIKTAAKAVVSRAGSGSLFEIAALGKPSILVPLAEAAQNHQVRNAYVYAENGAALVLEEENFTPHFFLERLRYLFSEPGILEKMSEEAKRFARPNAAKVISEYLFTYLSQ